MLRDISCTVWGEGVYVVTSFAGALHIVRSPPFQIILANCSLVCPACAYGRSCVLLDRSHQKCSNRGPVHGRHIKAAEMPPSHRTACSLLLCPSASYPSGTSPKASPPSSHLPSPLQPHQSVTTGAGPTGNTIFSIQCMRTLSIPVPIPMLM